MSNCAKSIVAGLGVWTGVCCNFPNFAPIRVHFPKKHIIIHFLPMNVYVFFCANFLYFLFDQSRISCLNQGRAGAKGGRAGSRVVFSSMCTFENIVAKVQNSWGLEQR